MMQQATRKMMTTTEGSLLLAFTTITHLYALPFAPSIFYEAIICMSTFLSFAWHISNKPTTSMLGILNYTCATLWILTDTWMSWNTFIFYKVFFGNSFIVILSCTLHFLEQKRIVSYSVSHSFWNLLSAAKAVYVATSLNSLNNTLAVV